LSEYILYILGTAAGNEHASEVKLATQVGILSDLDDFIENKKVQENEEDDLEYWRNKPYSPTHRYEYPGYMGIEVYQWYDYIDGLHANECMGAYENGYEFMDLWVEDTEKLER
jgi:hypothetical protein